MEAKITISEESDEPPGSGAENRFRPSPFTPDSWQFRQQHFPAATDREWNDWRWQLKHRIMSFSALADIIRLSDSERNTFQFCGATLPLAITHYYAGFIDPDDPDQPIRWTMLPVAGELLVSPGEARDPLGEDDHSPVSGLVHRSPDRVLFLMTDYCSSYCRYCTRSRMVGKRKNGGKKQWQRAIEYIDAHPEIRDVLVSGGDPLTLAGGQLAWLSGPVGVICQESVAAGQVRSGKVR